MKLPIHLASLCGPSAAFVIVLTIVQISSRTIAATPSPSSSAPSSVSPTAPSSAPSPSPSPAAAAGEEELRAAIKKKPKDLEAKTKLAKLLETKHDWNGIIELLQGSLPSLPRPGILALAKAYEMKNDNLSEMRTLDMCMAKDPKDYYCRTAQAQVYVRMKRGDDAINAYAEAKEMNPKFEPAYTGMLKQLEAAEDNYEARSLLADMVKVFGDKPQYSSDLCRLLSKEAFLEKTVEACNTAIATDSKNPMNYIYLATSLREKEEPGKSIELLKKGQAKFPKSEAILAALGSIELDQKKFPEAYAHYKAAIAVAPKSVDSWTGYGMAAVELQKYEEALSSFDHACELDRHAVKTFRAAATKLRISKESTWQSKFEDHINRCEPRY